MIPGVVASAREFNTPAIEFPQTSNPTASSFSGEGTIHVASLPGTLVVGDLLLAWAGFHIDQTDNIVLPTGWVLLARRNHMITGSKDVQLLLAARVVMGGEGNSVNFDTGAAANGAVQVYKIADWWGSIATGVSVATADSGGGVNPDPPMVVASWGVAKNLCITGGAAADDDQAWIDLPTNYTNLISTLSGGGADNGASVGTARREIEAGSESPDAFTLASSEGYALETVFVRPAA